VDPLASPPTGLTFSARGTEPIGGSARCGDAGPDRLWRRDQFGPCRCRSVEVQNFFGIGIDVQTNQDGTTALATAKSLGVADQIADEVDEVFGGRATLSNFPGASSGQRPAASRRLAHVSFPDDTSAVAARMKIPSLHGIKALRKEGLTGEDLKVGLLEVNIYVKAAIAFSTRCFGHHIPEFDVTSVNVKSKQQRQSKSKT
jgi:hypothetical protein